MSKLAWISMGSALILAISLTAATLVYAQEEPAPGVTEEQQTVEEQTVEEQTVEEQTVEEQTVEEQTAEKQTAEKQTAEKQARPAKALDPHKDWQEAHQAHQVNTAHVQAAMEAINAADKAIDAGNTAAAKAYLAKAKTHLTAVQKYMAKLTAKMGAVNTKCPMTGMAIDPAKVPANQMRLCKGKTIGFCSPVCAAMWDKLSEEEKMAKLAKVSPETKEQWLKKETKIEHLQPEEIAPED